MVMAEPTHRRHSNLPQRRATSSPRVSQSRVRLALGAMLGETGPKPAPAEEERRFPGDHLSSMRFCGREMNQFCRRGTDATSTTSTTFTKHPEPSVSALLKRIRIHPEAQRILGNSSIAVVSLERLNLQSVWFLQPLVSLVRLQCQTHAELPDEASVWNLPQNGFSDVMETVEETTSECSQPETTSSTEAFYPGRLSSGFDVESNPYHPYALLEPGSPEGGPDSETFYLDPDRELVIELVPQSETPPSPQGERGFGCEDSGGLRQRPDLPTQEVVDPGATPDRAASNDGSEDFCAVCLNGGDLLCCDLCPKVFHLACHVPPLVSPPLGDWVCTLCRTDHGPMEVYDTRGGVPAPYTLSTQDQRRCEKLTLLLCCNLLSAPFHEPVSPLAKNYYQIIKRPMDLSVIRKKLDHSNTLHYFTTEQFVDDVLLMFKNCATFNYPDSEVAQAGQNLEVFFLNKLKEIFPDQTFPSASRDGMDRARHQWLSGKRKDNFRKKRHVFSGRKYYL